MNIYVGNLSRETTEDDLHREFEAFGKISTISLMKDRFSGEPRGFGFVEMPTRTEAQAAIEAVNGKEINGRSLIVNEAKPRTERRDFGGGKSRNGGGRRSW